MWVGNIWCVMIYDLCVWLSGMAASLAFVSNGLNLFLICFKWFKFVSNVNRTHVSILCGKFTEPRDTNKPIYIYILSEP